MKLQISAVVASMVLSTTVARADVTISKKLTQNLSCVAGVCSPTASDAVLNTTDLANLLASGDVQVTTGSGATNIVVKAALGWTSTSRLTLDAIQSVQIDKPVIVTGTGAVTITTNDGGSGGDLIFDSKGNVTFWDLSSSLIVNGNSYTLVADIATLAGDIANNPSGWYALANDYDASVDGTYASAPLPGTFAGVFEGLGHDISNLKIVSSEYAVGLFGAAEGGAIRDIRLAKIAISGASAIVGSLLGEGDQIIVAGCSATGSITMGEGAAIVGGLIGKSYSISDGVVIRSHAAISVEAPTAIYVGGLVGSSGFAVSLSSAVGSVRAGDNSAVGGLIGTMSGGKVVQSYAIGSATAGKNAAVGGLLGHGNGTIENSYATGAVRGSATTDVGGFAGEIGGMRLQSSYSTGYVKGGSSSGGFIGNGKGSDDLGFDYWDTQTSGKSRHQGYGDCQDANCGRAIKGLTTQQFQSGLPDGFDPAIWGEKKTINGGFPYLLANPQK